MEIDQGQRTVRTVLPLQLDADESRSCSLFRYINLENGVSSLCARGPLLRIKMLIIFDKCFPPSDCVCVFF